jgi:multiple sugar transport system ATP-binding protein
MKSEKSQNKRMVLGIRPENIFLVPDGPSKGFSGQISVVEPMGSENWVELNFFHHFLKVKAPPHIQIKPGQTIPFTFQEEKIHLFDADTGLRVG